MEQEKVDRISELFEEVRTRLLNEVQYYARAGLSQVTILKRRGEESFFEWFEAKALQVEDRADHFFEWMNRPIDWVGATVDEMDCRTRKYRNLKECVEEEQMLHELELSRMMDEGGNSFDDFSDFEKEQFQKAS